ncbi:MAG: hypothetical protein A3F54_00745 [Candidatus Kerfeldbacteria bacterium RIFCSPHIGHO2_12_FULL_48_17]|uniref:Uncharacterized protein n=1 Tax=Candidatus Kerfeldbacteria bacterium RIFCSPHIGHO2_12_FULL_48_17 TaxID=1798542 RepID=A0A1G2B4E6_9BACT|nr:MAG: hypothetical protein A3F54_00745 [Candidatus Kerfeldbacteria bacterium RIFCSPHIGHO2_12_FULL_48_17]
MDIDFERPVFDQLAELVKKSPHRALSVINPMNNSDFCNAVGNLKNCYMCFDWGFGENCYYCQSGQKNKDCVDVVMCDDAEILYSANSCHKSYKVFWSEYASNCRDSYFLYDCVNASDCAFSTGLRHKQYVFMNEQLTREQYEAKIAELDTGSYAKLQEYLATFAQLKQAYPKRYLIGTNNENVSGNIIFNSKDVERGYSVREGENCVNVSSMWSLKDSLDVASFGVNTERVYNSSEIGFDAQNVQHSANSYDKIFNLEYCIFISSSNDCFASAFARKRKFAIFNKQYSPEEYREKVAQLKEKMRERGELGQLFRHDMVPFAYNESIAQFFMPLTRAEAERRGFRWAERKIPQVPTEKVLRAPDHIRDVKWEDVEGKFVVCAQSGRPFRIIRQEFDFYKKYNLPLPRVHPEVRLQELYPSRLMFQLRAATCAQCGKALQTSMLAEDKVLCETCYQSTKA